MNYLYHRIYLAGYSGWMMPRRLRRVIPRSQIHRAWFLGSTGHFAEDGIRYGLANPRTQERTCHDI